jgi:predicted ATPase/DNA-binding SARP family transcriptional activator
VGQVRFRVLGELVAEIPDAVRIGRSTRAAVLAALLRHRGRAVPVDELVDLVWGADAPATAATMVHGAVARLRTLLEPDRGAGPGRVIVSVEGGYAVGSEVRLDAATFERRLADGRALAATAPDRAAPLLAAALDLWRGPAYGGIEQPFARDDAARLEELRLQCVELRADVALALGRPQSAVAELQPLVAAHPTRERAAAVLLAALHAADRRAEAAALYRRTRRVLVDELGVEPGDALRTAAAHALGDGGRRGAVRLPTPISSFVGREDDLTGVAALLRAHRLTTLTGPGGTGKTRLAVEVGRRVAPDAVFVDLARARTPAFFDETIAEAFGIRFDSGSVAAAVSAAVADEPAVVVLDNCEHLLDRCATFVQELLGDRSRVRVLATSRQRLGVPGEQVHPVPSLPLAAPTAPFAQIRACAAVRLFAARAAATRSGFVVTAENAALVAELCRRLDALPLAVELAAAQASTMSLRTLADRLDERLLDATSRAAAPRHRSLAATLAWSLDLLPEAERALFLDLAVFPGGFDAEAVGAIGAVDDPAPALAHLVECSLVQAEDHATRFRLLATTRAFGRAHAAGLAALRRRHALHYCAIARRALPHLQRPGSGRWLAGLHRERDNLRAALTWAAGPDGDPDVLIGLCQSLWHYWDVRGSRGEGVRWLTAALAVVGPTRPERMGLLSAAALLQLGRAEFAATEALAREQHRLALAAGARRWAGDALALTATVAWARGQFDRAQQLYEDGIAAALAAGDLWGASMAEAQLARLHRDRCEPDAARVLAERAAAHADEVGEELARGLARDVAASIEHRWGDRTAAKRLAEEALEHYRLVGYREGEASSLHLAGRIALAEDDRARAERCFARALLGYRRIGHQAGVAAALESLAELAEEPESARLRDEAAAVRAEIGVLGSAEAGT